MKGVADIGWWSLFAGYLLLVIPVFVFWYYKTGLVKDTVIAIIRMTVQLLLLGVYLEYIFELNSRLLNLAWVFVMSIISAFTIIKRTNLSFKLFFLPVFIAGIVSIAITDAFFLGFVLRLDNIFDARYFIPITGMLLGNTLKNIIIALEAYYGRIKTQENVCRWHLASGATHIEAKNPFMRYALRLSFNPIIATAAIMGLISMPGIMTGQILGGSSPNVAIKYQIMLMITIFASGIMSAVLTILLSDRFAFDNFDNLRKDIFKKK